MFDLPTQTNNERRLASKFRNFLLKDGYFMMQFSVYIRLCNGLDRVQKHIKRLKEEAPKKGCIRILVVTERQYLKMEIITGKKSLMEEKTTDSPLFIL